MGGGAYASLTLFPKVFIVELCWLIFHNTINFCWCRILHSAVGWYALAFRLPHNSCFFFNTCMRKSNFCKFLTLRLCPSLAPRKSYPHLLHNPEDGCSRLSWDEELAIRLSFLCWGKAGAQKLKLHKFFM